MLSTRRLVALIACGALAAPGAAAAATVDLGPATGPPGFAVQAALPFGVPQIELGNATPTDAFTDVFAIFGQLGSSAVTAKAMVAAPNTATSTQTITVASTPQDLLVRDVNADGSDDILVPTGLGISIMRGFPSSVYTSASTITGSAGSSAVAAGLVNADLLPDLVAATATGFQVFGNTGVGTAPFSGSGSTGFTPVPARDIALGDLDGDGDRDLALSRDDRQLGVWLGAGGGSLAFAEQTPRALPGVTSAIAVGDVTGDARPEVVAAVPDASAVYLSGLTGSPATLAPWTRIDLGGAPADLALADLDGDGRREIIAALPGRDAVALAQPGEAPVLFPAGTGPASVAAGDMTGDGRPDVVAAPADPATWLVLANRGLPRAAVAPATIDAGAQATGTVGAPRTITVTAQDGARLRVGAASLSGPGRLDHLLTDDCAGAALEPGQSCTIATRFAPSAEGVRDATLAIPTSAGTRVVSLTGRGGAAPAGGGAPAAVKARATLTCKVVKVRGRARRGIDCRATLTGVTGARRLSAKLIRGRTTLASATAAPGGTLRLRPKKALAKGSVSVALTVSSSGGAVTARRAVTVR